MDNISTIESKINSFTLDLEANLISEDLKKFKLLNLGIVQIITIILLVFLIRFIFKSFIFLTLIGVILFEIISCRVAKINSPLNVLIFGEIRDIKDTVEAAFNENNIDNTPP